MAPTFNAIGLAAADMATTLAFYRALGLDIPAEQDTAPHAEAVLPGGIRLMFDSYASLEELDPDWTPGPEGAGGLAFLCDVPAEVDEVHAGLVKAGYASHKEPWDAPWGQRYAQIKDPDGRVVDLFAWIR
ncbi:VOC family protein [Actinoplanes sp. NPDC049265]|uniref:VOC family protein n=1 Tax=Actinoplanes sp. NPDC049265 TaxID=3363902 RepID=UPI00371E5CC0